MHTENKKPKSNKLLTAIIILLILIILATLGGSFFFTQKNSAPSVFGYNVFVMNGKGMEPSIKDKSAIITKVGVIPEKGEVALCKLKLTGNDNIVTVLRVVEIQEAEGKKQYYLKSDKGDNSEVIIAGQDEIVGKADIEVPWLGKVISFATSRPGIIAFIIIPAALILISLLVSILKHTDEEELEDNEQPEDEEEPEDYSALIYSEEENIKVEESDLIKSVEPEVPVEQKIEKPINKSPYEDTVFLPKRPEFIRQTKPVYDYEELAKGKPSDTVQEKQPVISEKPVEEVKEKVVETKKETIIEDMLIHPTSKDNYEEPTSYFEKMIAEPLADPIIEEKNKQSAESVAHKQSTPIEEVSKKEPVMASAQLISLDKNGKAEYNKVTPTADVHDLEKVLPAPTKNNSDRAAQSIDNLLKSVQSSNIKNSDSNNLTTPNTQKTTTNKTLEEMMKMLDQHNKNN